MRPDTVPQRPRRAVVVLLDSLDRHLLGAYGGYWSAGAQPNELDLEEDPAEQHDRVGTPDEKRAIDLLRAALDEVEAPSDHYERMGIA